MAGGAVDPEQLAAARRCRRPRREVVALGQLRAAAQLLDVLAELAGLVVVETAACARAWASWRAIGMRPVLTWNSTEAAADADQARAAALDALGVAAVAGDAAGVEERLALLRRRRSAAGVLRRAPGAKAV